MSWLFKKKRGAGMGGALGVLDQVFHPSGHNAAMIREEQAEARKPMPSPEDKGFDGVKIVIQVPAKEVSQSEYLEAHASSPEEK
jgi:hypothetical protein